MLEQIISKAHRILIDAQQTLSVESAAAVEQVHNDIVILNDFIDKELSAIERNSGLDDGDKKKARRRVFEQAGRKLEAVKAKRNYSDLSDAPEVKSVEKPLEDERSFLQFLREKEVRDRLFGMTEAQIVSLFGDSLFDGSNPLLRNAILNAPPGFEPVSKDAFKKMQQAGAGKIRTGIADELETVRNLNAMVGEMFSIVKKELDHLRRKELPTALTQPAGAKDRPFRF
jgi:hypothetical protein